MKKLLSTTVLLATLALPGLCLAGTNGEALSKAEKSGDVFVNLLKAKASYTEFAPTMAPNMRKQVKAGSIPSLVKQVQEKFGTMKEVKFYSFERFDKIDKLVYIANFSKEKVASLVIFTDKDGKIDNFALSPLKAQSASQNKK